MDLLTTKPNGFSEGQAQPTEEEELTKQTSAIKGMWKKAFKSLKSNDKQTWLVSYIGFHDIKSIKVFFLFCGLRKE